MIRAQQPLLFSSVWSSPRNLWTDQRGGKWCLPSWSWHWALPPSCMPRLSPSHQRQESLHILDTCVRAWRMRPSRHVCSQGRLLFLRQEYSPLVIWETQEVPPKNPVWKLARILPRLIYQHEQAHSSYHWELLPWVHPDRPQDLEQAKMSPQPPSLSLAPISWFPLPQISLCDVDNLLWHESPSMVAESAVRARLSRLPLLNRLLQ